MKNREVIDAILAYHPTLEGYEGCDEYKCGDPEAECTGVAVALVPTADVIDRAAKLGCNLIVTHEPVFFQTPDFGTWKGEFSNQVYEDKKVQIADTGMCIWRDHDHMHANRPDSIFGGVVKELGWENYEVKGRDFDFNYCFEIPETTIGDLGKFMMEKLGLNGLKYMGDPTAKVTKVALVGHLFPGSFGREGMDEKGHWHEYAMEVMKMMEQEGVQVIIPGEIIEWTVLAYIRDAIYQGKVKGCLNIGHFNLEELGMKDFAKVIKGLVDEDLNVTYVPTKDAFSFM